MTSDEFQHLLEEMFLKIENVLGNKADEYATEDRLANFKTASNLMDVGVPQALAGMMVKHTVSIYDMVQSGKPFSVDVWDEKIIDHINYLILLKATLIDVGQFQPKG